MKRHNDETRRFYYVDTLLTKEKVTPFYVDRERTEAYLRTLMARVWQAEARQYHALPTLEMRSGKDVSCCIGTPGYGHSHIVIYRWQASIATLLHELTHALGYKRHGRGFARRYVELLVKYGKCEEGKLLLAMGLMGVNT